MSYKYMTIFIKLYICKSQEQYVQKIIRDELLFKLTTDFESVIFPLQNRNGSLYEKYTMKNESKVELYISIPIQVDKKRLLSRKVSYNFLTKNIFTKHYIAKYLQNSLTHILFWHMYNHPDINMKSTSLKYLHVNPL